MSLLRAPAGRGLPMPAIDRRAVVGFGLLLPLSGCALFKKDPPPAKEIEIKKPAEGAKIDLVVTVSPLANAGRDGIPSSLVLRFYVLSAPTRFVEANFFELWEKDEATLGETMLGKKELFLNPGEVQHVRAPLSPDALAVAVTAGFEDFQIAKWRAVIPLQGEKTLKIRAKVDSGGVTLEPRDD